MPCPIIGLNHYAPKFSYYAAFWHFLNFLPIMLVFMLELIRICLDGEFCGAGSCSLDIFCRIRKVGQDNICVTELVLL